MGTKSRFLQRGFADYLIETTEIFVRNNPGADHRPYAAPMTSLSTVTHPFPSGRDLIGQQVSYHEVIKAFA
jgi:hypothetical protein